MSPLAQANRPTRSGDPHPSGPPGAEAGPAVTVTIEGEDIPLCVRINARARRVILKIDPVTANLIMVLHQRRDLEHALDFARRQGAWIMARRRECRPGVPFRAGETIPVLGQPLILTPAPDLKRRTIEPRPQTGHLLVGGPPEHLPRRVKDWLKTQARSRILERVGAHAACLEVNPRRITLRDTRSRWGSCSADGALSFSWRLIMAPMDILDYVAAHEVAHLLHHDHSPAFWAAVHRIHPDPKRATRWLKSNGTDLHRYGAV